MPKKNKGFCSCGYEMLDCKTQWFCTKCGKSTKKSGFKSWLGRVIYRALFGSQGGDK